MKKNLLLQLIPLLLLTFSYACSHILPEGNGSDTRPQILKKLDGEWRAKGEVMGDEVEYSVSVRPVLNSTFSELHMTDISNPPEYEALVFIGYDTAEKKIISHWLDSFGPAFSIPHGTGSIDSNTIEFIIPYTEGPFRDRLTFNENDDTWLFLIESSTDSISWKKFAGYIFTRR